MHVKRNYQLSQIPSTLLSDFPYFRNKSISIVGMIRNHDSTLQSLLNQIDNLCCLFKICVVLIYESNSNDNTPNILKKWQIQNNLNNQLCSKYNNNINSNHQPLIIKKLLSPSADAQLGIKYADNRLDRYSEYRNYILNETINFALINNIKFDYWTPIDLDIYSIDILSILNQLYLGNNYSVICTNGVKGSGYMWDTLATVLLDGTWLYKMGQVKRSNLIYKKQFTDVISCFGGMAFYKFNDIIKTNCKYISTKISLLKYPELKKYFSVNKEHGDKGICEHISFNYCLYDKNMHLAIAKDAYLYYGWRK